MGSSSSKIKARLEGAPVVVIVGGGYGGVALAKALDSQCNVVLIDRKDYFFHNIGALRSCTLRLQAGASTCGSLGWLG